MNIKDWEGVSHNFMTLTKSENVIGKYPELKEVFGGYYEPNAENVFRYIIAYYNIDSPIRTEPDIITRKRKAAAVAGWEFDSSGRFSKDVEEILLGRSKDVNKLILDYCYFQNNADFVMLAVYEQGLYIEQTNLLESPFNKDTVKKIKEIKDEIDTLKKTILNGDILFKSLVNQLQQKTKQIILELKPENIADKIKQGLAPVDVTPYGSDYKFKKYGKKGRLRKV